LTWLKKLWTGFNPDPPTPTDYTIDQLKADAMNTTNAGK
jgi:hypothetical protein